MSIAQNYPEIKPSLNLDFANVKKLDPRVTFARASEGRYYDGVTTAKAEENLLSYSQEFNIGWVQSGAVVTVNDTTAPDGTTTADLVLANSGAASTGHGVYRDLTLGSGYVLTVFAKKGTNDFFQICSDSSSVHYANFDLASGVVGTTGSGFINETIESIGNGWYRCKVEFNFSSASNRIRFLIVSSSSAAWRENFSAVGTESIYLWGAQLEQRSSVTAYTPTTSQPITNYIPVLQTASANVARFDHDPVTGESLGLLVEEQRANLITRSEEFNETAWIKTRATITPNMLIAPDGSLSADKLVEDSTASSTHFIEFQRAGSIGNFALSCYCKASERSIVRVALFSSTINSHATFDLSTGTASSPNSVLDYSITPVGNGWYRCFISANQPDSRTLQVRILLVDSGTNITYTGDGYSGIYIWGAQLESGQFPTSYIPTTSSQVTRSADAASMTGTNFSEWFSNAEGTLYAEGTPVSASTRYLALLFDGTASNRIGLAWVTSSLQQVAVASGTTQSNLISGTTPLYASLKAATSYTTNDFSLAVNGGSVLSDTSGVVPNNVNQMQIGAYTSNSFSWSGHIKKISYYTQALSATNLQALTGS